MPIIQVYYPQGALNQQLKATLAQKLTSVLITMEGGAGTAAGQAFASVLMTQVETDSWWVGGHTDETFVAKAGKFLVYVTIPEGYMNAQHKSEVHSLVNTAMLEATGFDADPGAGANILVVINEVPEGNWGAGGKTIGLGNISAAVGLPKNGERSQWITKYFAAKQRALKAAGYPDDIGGLISTKQ